MGQTNQGMLFDAPERPEHPRRPPTRVGRALVVVGACGVFLSGAVTMFYALLFGPGQREELVSGDQPGVLLWFGLPSAGMIAAVIALTSCRQPRSAAWALLAAALSVGAWWAGVLLFV